MNRLFAILIVIVALISIFYLDVFGSLLVAYSVSILLKQLNVAVFTINYLNIVRFVVIISLFVVASMLYLQILSADTHAVYILLKIALSLSLFLPFCKNGSVQKDSQ